MNRQQRRQQQREQRRRSTIQVPDGKLVRAEILTPGGVEEVTNWRQIPAKREGVHRWVCTVSHYMTPEQAEAFAGRDESAPVLLDASNIMFAGLGCIDCEGVYEAVLATPCPAGDEWAQ